MKPKPKPTLIDMAFALAGLYRDCELGVHQIHILTLIIAMRARRIPCDSRAIMSAFPDRDRRLTSNVITILEGKGYVKSKIITRPGCRAKFRQLLGTEKAAEFVANLQRSMDSALDYLPTSTSTPSQS